MDSGTEPKKNCNGRNCCVLLAEYGVDLETSIVTSEEEMLLILCEADSCRRRLRSRAVPNEEALT